MEEPVPQTGTPSCIYVAKLPALKLLILYEKTAFNSKEGSQTRHLVNNERELYSSISTRLLWSTVRPILPVTSVAPLPRIAVDRGRAQQRPSRPVFLETPI